MGRTNNLWVVNIFIDDKKELLFKTLEFETLNEIAYVLNKPLYEITNFYHKIKKPNGIFKYIYIYKTYNTRIKKNCI